MDNDTQPLHLKYRPTDLEGFVGNSILVRSLQDTLGKRGKPHSYLFHGPSGCGKTTLARITGGMLGCSKRDFRELNSANYRGIESIRDLISKAGLTPMKGDVVVYLMDEVHMLTREAQNAVLKLLEEPPGHCYFVLCTTEPEKLLKTIRTRCAQFAVTGLGRRQIVTHLDMVVRKESGTGVESELIKEIARACSGSMRQALMILDQVMGIEDLDEAIDAVHDAMGEERQVTDLCRALAKTPKWKVLAPILMDLQGEPESIRYAVLGYFNTVALRSDDPFWAMVVIKHFTPSMMYSGKAGLASACWEVTEEFSK